MKGNCERGQRSSLDSLVDQAEPTSASYPTAPSTELAALRLQVEALTIAVRDLAKRMPTLVTIEEAARVMGVSPRTARRRVQLREWPHVKVGRDIRVDLSVIRPGLART